MTVKPHSLILKALKLTWKSFAVETSIHGLKYAVGRRRLDRWIWTIVPLISTMGAAYLVSLLYTSYWEKPTRAIYETHFAPLIDFSYPGFSICSPRRFTKKNIRTMVNRLKIPANVSKSDIEALVPNLLGFTMGMNVSENINLPLLDAILKDSDLSPQDALKLLTPGCRKILTRCRWQGLVFPCTDLFIRAKTKLGYCCSFNYNTDFRDAYFPGLYSPYFGPAMGLSVVIDTIGMYNKQVFHDMDSFKLLVHSSQSFAGRSTKEIVMPLFSEINIAFTPMRIKIGPQAIILSAENRKCYLTDEFRLTHFALYRKTDCLVQCEITKSKERCGCQPFMYPRIDTDIVCNASAVPCLFEHFQQVQAVNWESNCFCPPQCNENFTEVTVDTTDLDGISFNSDPLYNELTENQTLVNFYAGREYGTVVKKAVVTYWVDLLSSFGGVFNLFLGCSLLSIVEMAYFLLVKFPLRYWKMFKKAKQTEVKVLK